MCDCKLHYLSVHMQKEKGKKQSQEKKPIPKAFPKQYTFLLSMAPWMALLMGGGKVRSALTTPHCHHLL